VDDGTDTKLVLLGRPKTSDSASRTTWILLAVALLAVLIPWGPVRLLDKLGDRSAWKSGLLIFVTLMLCPWTMCVP